jgi:hypothetical protein
MNDRPCNQEELTKFFNTTQLHDEYRKQEFAETFPELYNLLKEYNV